MSLATPKHWKRLDDTGKVTSIFRRRMVDGLIRMESYTYRGEWSDAYDYLLQAVEDPDFVEISSSEAAQLMPKVVRSAETR